MVDRYRCKLVKQRSWPSYVLHDAMLLTCLYLVVFVRQSSSKVSYKQFLSTFFANRESVAHTPPLRRASLLENRHELAPNFCAFSAWYGSRGPNFFLHVWGGPVFSVAEFQSENEVMSAWYIWSKCDLFFLNFHMVFFTRAWLSHLNMAISAISWI